MLHLLQSLLIVAPVTKVGVDKTEHDKMHWNGELDAPTPNPGGSYLRGASLPFELKQSEDDFCFDQCFYRHLECSLACTVVLDQHDSVAITPLRHGNTIRH